MRTNKQSNASRRNGGRSHGPATDAGKAASSMNALRHGLRSTKIVLPGENQEDYDHLHDEFQQLYTPANQAEQYLVDQAAIAQWKLARAEAYEHACFNKNDDPEKRAALFGRMSQITTRLERTYFKAYKELERIKAARPKPQPVQEQETKPEEQPKKEEPQQEPELDEHGMPKNMEWVVVNHETGERDVVMRRIDGVTTNYFKGVPF